MISLHPHFSSHRFAGPAIALGGFIFSSSIMLLVFNRAMYVTLCRRYQVLMVGNRARVLGPVTPLGGIITILGCAQLNRLNDFD